MLRKMMGLEANSAVKFRWRCQFVNVAMCVCVCVCVCVC